VEVEVSPSGAIDVGNGIEVKNVVGADLFAKGEAVWKVYDDLNSPHESSIITAKGSSPESFTLEINDASFLISGPETFYITLTESGKDESEMTALVIQPTGSASSPN